MRCLSLSERGIALLSLLAFFFASTVHAENLVKPELRQGYYISAGPSFGMTVVDSTDGVTGPWPGPGMNVRIGEAFNPWFDLGVGFIANWGFQDDYKLVSGSFSLEATVNPTPSFFIVLGAGAGWADFTRQKKGMDEIIGRFSASYTILAGWDIFMGPQRARPYQSGGFSLVPLIGVQLSPSTAATSSYLFLIGVNLTWWSGLPINHLDLPPDLAF